MAGNNAPACLIQNAKGENIARGFHVGRGWIMAIVDAENDPDKCYELLCGGKFVFGGQGTVSTPEGNPRRIAYIQPCGGKIIAMVKLGTQIDGRKNAPDNWEDQEQQNLQKIKLPSIDENKKKLAIGCLLNDGNDGNDVMKNEIIEFIKIGQEITKSVQRYTQFKEMGNKEAATKERQEFERAAPRNLKIYLMKDKTTEG